MTELNPPPPKLDLVAGTFYAVLEFFDARAAEFLGAGFRRFLDFATERLRSR